MRYNLTFTLFAEKDIEEIIEWYGKQNIDLSRKFIISLDKTVQSVTKNPFLFQEVYKNYRCINCDKFPYKIIYRTIENNIIVTAITHHKRNPKIWKVR